MRCEGRWGSRAGAAGAELAGKLQPRAHVRLWRHEIRAAVRPRKSQLGRGVDVKRVEPNIIAVCVEFGPELNNAEPDFRLQRGEGGGKGGGAQRRDRGGGRRGLSVPACHRA